MIQAEVHSDDHNRKSQFDATAWFEQASDKEIIALANCEWGGDYPADAVARFMSESDKGVAGVFEYLEFANDDPALDTIGFECHVDPQDAVNWLVKNKPQLGFDASDPYAKPVR